MCRIMVSLLLVWTLCVRAGADDDQADLKQALALQKVMQKAIRNAEPSIACILVSRSDAYRRLGLAPTPGKPGKLGGFIKKNIDIFDNDWKKLDLSLPDTIPEAFGIGVVIDAKGLILTNYHVVRDATKIFVRLPGNKSSYADIKAADPRSDLAVLELLTKIPGLKAITLGDASKCARGQFVLTLANPFAAGFRDGQPSASWGILSNIRRRAIGPVRAEKDLPQTLQHYGNLLQTDARLNLGCSGGALLNLQGEMIGLTTALAAIHGGETPGGFAVPIDASMLRIIEVLKRGEEVNYGFLGISWQYGVRPRGQEKGVLVETVIRGSPAENKLRVNDTILKVDNFPVRERDDLFLALGTKLAGARVTLVVQRFGAEIEVKDVELAKFQVNAKGIFSSLNPRPFFRGLRVDYTSLLAQGLRRESIPQGVLISDVQEESAAAKADLKIGDVITRVQGRPVFKPADFYREIAGIQGPVQLTLNSTNFPHPKVTLNP
jgi:S1-C subfamily serine protease